MKTQTFTQKNTLRTMILFGLLMIFSLASHSLFAQTERIVKGVITDETGPIEGATVILKGTNIYVDTDEQGAFTFPQKLKDNDALVVHHLGYEKREVIVGPDMTFVNILMDDYAIVIVGALLMGDNVTPIRNDNH